MEIRSNRALIGRLTSQIEGKRLLLVLGTCIDICGGYVLWLLVLYLALYVHVPVNTLELRV